MHSPPDVASESDITPCNKIYKQLFMHRIRCAKLFEAAKTQVQIMRFTYCLNMAFNLIMPKMCPDLFGTTIHMTHYFGDAFVRKTLWASMTLWRRYGV